MNPTVHMKVIQSIPQWGCVTASGELADSNNPAHEDHVVGITEGSISWIPGKSDWGDVTTSGHVYDQNWSWTPGAAIYLNSTGISQTAPGLGFVQRIGWAITATELVVDFAPVSAGPVGPAGPAGPPGPPGPAGANAFILRDTWDPSAPPDPTIAVFVAYRDGTASQIWDPTIPGWLPEP